jgi:tetratricopeptide (TPR) repeat protein/spermidine synthase
MPANLPEAMLQKAVGEKHQKIIYYKEGRTGTVSVTQNTINKERQLFMNAVNEVTTRLVHDQSFKMLGHLAPLLHPNPQKGLMICFGAGISAGAALRHPLKSLDIVDLSATIPTAAKYFKKENNNVLKDERLKLHINDGRQFLLQSNTKFDVMMIDSTHPKAVDSWILYTRDFYRLVKKRLAPKGIVVQWLPLHGLSVTEFKIIVKTFLNVFPNMTMWMNVGFELYGKAAYVKLVGTVEPLKIDYKELALRLKEPRIQKDLAPYGMDSPFEILDCFAANSYSIKNWVKNVTVQTDDKPFLPYITAYSTDSRMDASYLLPVRTRVFDLLYNMGQAEAEISQKLKQSFDATGFLMAGKLEQAETIWPDGKKIKLYKKRMKKTKDYYLALATLYKDNSEKLFETANYLGNLSFSKEAVKIYRQALTLNPNDLRIKINMALAFLDASDESTAHDLLIDVLEQNPHDPLANYNFAVVLHQEGSAGQAISYLKRAISINDKLYGARLLLAQCYLDMKRLAETRAVLKQLLLEKPFMAKAYDMLGLVYAEEQKWDKARQYHVKALEINPYIASAHYNLGIALQEEGRLKEAEMAYLAALKIEPDDAEAHNNLGLVYGEAGMFDQAIKEHKKALNLEPQYPEAAFNLGLAYKNRGNILLAAKSFALALKINPDLKAAKKQLKELGIENVDIKVDTDDSKMIKQ